MTGSCIRDIEDAHPQVVAVLCCQIGKGLRLSYRRRDLIPARQEVLHHQPSKT